MKLRPGALALCLILSPCCLAQSTDSAATSGMDASTARSRFQQFCTGQPEKCEQLKEYCRANRSQCQQFRSQMQAARQQVEQQCQQDPAGCEQKKQALRQQFIQRLQQMQAQNQASK